MRLRLRFILLAVIPLLTSLGLIASIQLLLKSAMARHRTAQPV